MATYEPFHIYREGHFPAGGPFVTEGHAALPVAGGGYDSAGFMETLHVYFDVPETTISHLAVAVNVDHPDIDLVKIDVVTPAFDLLTAFELNNDGDSVGADLGTAEANAVFDYTPDAPAYGTFIDSPFEWTLTAPTPISGHYRAADIDEEGPTGTSAPDWLYGTTTPASITAGVAELDHPADDCWSVRFQMRPVETSPGTWEIPAFSINDVQLILNELVVDETFHEPFTVQITPLIAPSELVSTADLVDVAQFADLNVTHPLNGGRTAQVTLSMDDPVVETLEPYEFALRVLYGYDGRHEPVFWGQAWFEEDYDAGTITIYAQDPSLRLQHHYLRLGDDALNHGETGQLTADYIGIRGAVDAARNTEDQDTRGDPDLGIANGTDTDITLIDPIEVERGQECWDVINQLADHRAGPDFDLRTVWSLPSANYVAIDCYGSEDDGLGRDLTATDPDSPASGEVVFDYGVGQDNLGNVRHRPGRPTTHAHVVDGLLAKATRANVAGSMATGVFVDWIGVDFKEVTDSGGSLADVAKGRVGALGRPPKFLELELRPDVVQARLYGHPDFPTNPGDFYVGDIVTVRATRGHRSFDTPARITEVQLTQAGWRAPAVTVLKVLPTVDGETVDEEQ